MTEYFDKYLFESDPRLLRRVAEAMQPLVPPPDTELLGGLELGGIPLATIISSLTGIPAVFVRKKAKEYGTRRLAEGAEVAGRRTCLIEDIVTTGGAARDATKALRVAGATVPALVCTHRSQPDSRQGPHRRRGGHVNGLHPCRPRRDPPPIAHKPPVWIYRSPRMRLIAANGRSAAAGHQATTPTGH